MRDFDKVFKYNIEELINYIISEFHSPLREDLVILEQSLKDFMNIPGDNEKKILVKELFSQFQLEIINHINREESDFFPTIIELEKGTEYDKNTIKNFLRLQIKEHNEIDHYLISGKEIMNELIGDDIDKFGDLKKITKKIFGDTLDHVYVENNHLNLKVESLLK